VLSAIVFLPALGALLIALLPGGRGGLPDRPGSGFLLNKGAKQLAAAVTLADLGLAIAVWTRFDSTSSAVQLVERQPWVLDLNIHYYLGIDGLNLPMVLLTAFLGFLAVLVSWNINHRVKLYFVSLLVLESGILGVFTALDFVLFFLFWEVELLPMFLLIAVWGSPPPLGRREYSAWKFLLYTFFGSAFMLLGLLAVYWSAGSFDLIQLRDPSTNAGRALAQAGIPAVAMFWSIFLAFAIKLPVFPFHTWLPDAHTDAPTAASVILAGVLLKMGGYGMVRVCISLFPWVAAAWAPVLAFFATVNVIYGALVTLRQKDLKRLVAYSSVSHMGYVLLGIAALGEVGMTGAVLQMVTHGTITGLLFALVGLVYDKTHTRQIPELRGLAHRMPFIGTVFVVAALASLGLPTMSGFVAEFLVFVGTYPAFGLYTVLGAAGIVLAAGYMLWVVERSFFQTPLQHLREVGDATWLERVPLVALVGSVMLVGIWPGIVTDVIRVGLAPILGRF